MHVGNLYPDSVQLLEHLQDIRKLMKEEYLLYNKSWRKVSGGCSQGNVYGERSSNINKGISQDLKHSWRSF